MIRETHIEEWAKQVVGDENFEMPMGHEQILPPGVDAEMVRQAHEAYIKSLYGSNAEVKMVMVPLLFPVIKST